MGSMGEDRDIRPDVGYSITSSSDDFHRDYSHEELAREQKGFHCENCDWRALSFPVTESPGDILDSICPECGEPEVTNLLTKHVNIIREKYENDDRDWVPYSYFVRRFPGPQDRLDETLNHLISRKNAYVVFEDGWAMLYIEPESEDL